MTRPTADASPRAALRRETRTQEAARLRAEDFALWCARQDLLTSSLTARALRGDASGVEGLMVRAAIGTQSRAVVEVSDAEIAGALDQIGRWEVTEAEIAAILDGVTVV